MSLISSDEQITRNEYSKDVKGITKFSFDIGDNFGDRYKIIKELGKGGMGFVFLAHDNVLEIDVALKMIRPEFLSKRKMVDRFKKEILLAREITNENVVRIYDFGDIDGIKFISMEYIKGRTLKEIIREDGPLSIDRAIEISKSICKGLEAAHKNDIIHRDLKPQNVMIDDDQKVYVTDFGLAKSRHEVDIGTSGHVIGTPQYIAPELWKGKIADKRSDIYALGIIMFEMVSGRELYQSITDFGYLQKHLNEKPVFRKFEKERTPTFFRNLILKCLSKEMESRYQNCKEIYRDLNDKLFSRGTFLSEVERSVKKIGPLKIGLSFVLIFFVSLFSIIMVENKTDVQKKRSLAVLYFKNLSGLTQLDNFSYSLPELLTTDLSQSKYIKVLPECEISKILTDSNYLSGGIRDQKIFEQIGKKVKVNYLVQGSFVKSGDELRITVKLRDSESGEMISTDYVDASVDNIYPSIDRLTTGLKKRLNLTENEIFSDIDKNIKKIITSSQKALNHYISGRQLLNKCEFQESLKEYKEAVKIDPEFAMAYKDMAENYNYINDLRNRLSSLEKSIEFINKLPEREKYLVYGDYYSIKERTYNKSIEAYNQLLKIYPFDMEGNFKLGKFYRKFSEWDKGLKYLNKAFKEDNRDINVLKELVKCYKGMGEVKKALKLINDFEIGKSDREIIRILPEKYNIYIILKKFDLASTIVEKYNKLGKKNGKTIESERIKYNYLNRGQFNRFEKLTRTEIKNSSSIDKVLLQLSLAELYYRSEKYEKSLTEIKERDTTMDEDFPNIKQISDFYESLSLIELEKVNEAKILLRNIKRLSKKSLYKKESLKRLNFLLGKMAEKSENLIKAEDYYKKCLDIKTSVSNLNGDSFIYYNLGKFYYFSDDLNKAEDIFEEIGKLTLEKLISGDIYAKSLFFMGKIFQRRKWNKKALEVYEKFYSQWKDGDSEYVKKYIDETKDQLKLLRKSI